MRISDNESSDSDEERDSEDDLVVAHYSSAESSESKLKYSYLAKLILDVILGHHFLDAVTVFCISFKLRCMNC